MKALFLLLKYLTTGVKACASTAGGVGLIPGWGTKTPYATQRGQKQQKNKNTNSSLCSLNN